MDLNQVDGMHQIDRGNYLSQIESLPTQLESAWALAKGLPLSVERAPRQIIIAGMGGSAIGGELACAIARKYSSIPVSISREYYLPQWALNSDTLVVASSYSGNTEETLSVFEQAKQANCQLLALTRGGKLSELAGFWNASIWPIQHTGQPRAAVASSFGLILGLLSRLGLIPDFDQEVLQAVRLMQDSKAVLGVESPIHQNPAKRLAGQWYGRLPVIVGSDLMAPIALRWVGQINELAKGWGQALYLPEMDHNTLAGILQPAEAFSKLAVVYLQSKTDHPRNVLRSNLTREIFMLEGINTDTYQARGETDLEQMWSAIQFGDYAAFYLAMMYEMDPTPIPAIEQLKVAMKV